MRAKERARWNLAINIAAAVIGVLAQPVTEAASWEPVKAPAVVIGMILAALGVLRAAFGASPASGE